MGALVAAGDVMDAASPKPPALRYWLAAAITYVLFSNHWSRDSVGALELDERLRGNIGRGGVAVPGRVSRLLVRARLEQSLHFRFLGGHG